MSHPFGLPLGCGLVHYVWQRHLILPHSAVLVMAKKVTAYIIKYET
jgi:hypothetical protein